MTHFRFALRATLFIAALSPLAALAKQPHVPAVAELRPELPQSQYTSAGRFEVGTLTPLALYGLSVPVAPDTPEQMARAFLRTQGGLLQLKDLALADLQWVWTRSDATGHNVQFEQRVAGVPVYDSRLTVHISPDHRVTFVSSGYRPRAALAIAQLLVSGQQARAAVLKRLNAQAPLRHDSTQLVAVAGRTLTRLAWQVQITAAHPIGGWEALVDAITGEIFVLWDRDAYANGSVFDPDPLSSSHTKYGAPMQDNDDADSPELTAQIVTKPLGDVDFADGMYMLKNQWAEISDHETPSNGLFQQPSPDFLFTREPNGFEAANTFWHIQDSMRYVNETLGLQIRPYQYDGGVQFDPQGLDGEDNSHYDSSTGQLAYGEGCVDDDEDADVIRHELGHGLHDWVTHGGLSNEIDGLSEGFGDYWAVSYSRRLNQWQPGEPEYNWVYSWDGHNECWSGRTVDYKLGWPLGLGEQHTSGQIWSTCLMKIFDQIGPEKTDTAALEGLAMTGVLATQVDAANAVYQAAQDLQYSASEQQMIHDTFASCGYIMSSALFPLPVVNSPNEVPHQTVFEGKPSDSGEGGGGGALGLWLLLPLLGLAVRRRH
ncbi:MAG TPA: GlyGly-CTERM sorting domain-containing protein [Nevskiaceae bacterium]|nr:GlyGly-CTERM sorting domain-containing protein [Nevskiaceae bacterium]